MNDYLVSIIMPILNGEMFMRRAIESVIKQSYTNWELVIVDDGSKDGTFEIAKQYSKEDSRIVALKNDGMKHGTNVARNMGIKASKGSLITFLDCDDYYLKDSLLVRVSLFLDNKDVSMVYGNAFCVIDHVMYKWEYPKYSNEKRVLKHLARELSLCQQNTIMVKKTALESVGFLDESLRCWTDDDLVLSIGFRYKVISSGKFLTVVDKENSIMTSNKDNAYLGLKHLLVKYRTQIVRYAGLKRLMLWYVRLFGALCFAFLCKA